MNMLAVMFQFERVEGLNGYYGSSLNSGGRDIQSSKEGFRIIFEFLILSKRNHKMDGKALEMVVGDLTASINEVGLQG